MFKILVTGGAGFIGSTLVRKLVNLENHVVVVDNFSRGSKHFLPVGQDIVVNHLDIRETDLITKAAEGCDAIVHLAAYGSVVESVADPTENYSVNVEGTFSVLNAAKRAGVRKLIFASTGGALIGNAIPPVSELSLPRPISPYGASKLAGEGYCCAFANAYNMDIIALRFANVIGPQSLHKKGAVTNFFKSIINGEPIIIYGDGSSTRDFLYVDDLCQGIIKAINSNLFGFNVFHLASGKETTIRQLAELCIEISEHAGHPLIFKTKRDGEVERNFALSLAANVELGFDPVVSLVDGLARTWKWIKSQYN